MSIAGAEYHPYQDEYRMLFGAFGVSVRTLPDKLRERYRMLAIFQEDATIPDSVLCQLWQTNEADVRSTLTKLAKKSLLTRDAPATDVTCTRASEDDEHTLAV